MYYALLVLLVLDAILLTTVVLLQAGKGGGLAAMGAAGTSSDSLFGTRHATTLLTKATWWTGAIFLVLAFTLSLMAGATNQPSSILREGLQAPVTPGLPGITEPVSPEGAGTAPAATPSEAPAGAAETGAAETGAETPPPDAQ